MLASQRRLTLLLGTSTMPLSQALSFCFFNHTPCQSCQRNSCDKSSLSRQQAGSGLRYFIKMLAAAREAHSNRRVSISAQVPPLSAPNTASPWPRQLDVRLPWQPAAVFLTSGETQRSGLLRPRLQGRPARCGSSIAPRGQRGPRLSPHPRFWRVQEGT